MLKIRQKKENKGPIRFDEVLDLGFQKISKTVLARRLNDITLPNEILHRQRIIEVKIYPAPPSEMKINLLFQEWNTFGAISDRTTEIYHGLTPIKEEFKEIILKRIEKSDVQKESPQDN